MNDYLGLIVAAIAVIIASVLPIQLIRDKQRRSSWDRMLFWLCVASVILNGIWQVLCMELFNADGSAPFLWCFVICILVSLWVSVRWGLDSVKNSILRILLVSLRGLVISAVLSVFVIFGSFALVLLITGRGGA